MNTSVAVCFAFCLAPLTLGHRDPHFWNGRNTIVNLFEWKWRDVADECERFLQHKGYAGVQISPPNENLVIENRPWWERYQPVSYKLKNRSGNETDFTDMTRRCNAVGIRIYADVVVNHMTAGNGMGTGGSEAYYHNTTYPAVPYNPNDFHRPCGVKNYQDPVNVRNCRLKGLADLNQGLDHVREEIIVFMNHLISLGVAGFRIDAAKHMWPTDLAYIFSKLNNLNVNFGFSSNSKPFIYQEVIDYGGEAISKHEYTDLGSVVEFKFSYELCNAFRGNNKLSYLKNWGPAWSLLPSDKAIAFVDNHDNQRSGGVTLTYKEPKKYKMAIAFMLAHPYGTTRIISSFSFDDKDQGPPADASGNLISPKIKEDGSCSNEYVCEHRWKQISNMVEFRNVVAGTNVDNWWSDDNQQIAFSRGNKGFVVFTNGGQINKVFQTALPPGTYCDVISGEVLDGKCTGKTVTVGEDGMGQVLLSDVEGEGALAIHIKARLNFM
ncbi:alpha-amylase-like [Zophobas morio]|uniref:alpha-amylase-like n=1 Tax=Zophobas morio TaxID=2755281 RepID=UPI003082BF1B